jgi:hypothetical protein
VFIEQCSRTQVLIYNICVPWISQTIYSSAALRCSPLCQILQLCSHVTYIHYWSVQLLMLTALHCTALHCTALHCLRSSPSHTTPQKVHKRTNLSTFPIIHYSLFMFIVFTHICKTVVYSSECVIVHYFRWKYKLCNKEVQNTVAIKLRAI